MKMINIMCDVDCVSARRSVWTFLLTHTSVTQPQCVCVCVRSDSCLLSAGLQTKHTVTKLQQEEKQDQQRCVCSRGALADTHTRLCSLCVTRTGGTVRAVWSRGADKPVSRADRIHCLTLIIGAVSQTQRVSQCFLWVCVCGWPCGNVWAARA